MAELAPGVRAVTVVVGDVGPAEWVWMDTEGVLVISQELPADDHARVFINWLSRARKTGTPSLRTSDEAPA